jgi:hypothetical protein
MERGSRCVAAALAVVMLGLALAASASANSLSLVNGEQGFRFVWTSAEIEAAGNLIQCPLTLEGSFSSRSFTKTAGAEIALITRASLESAGCTGGRATALGGTLPWAIQYVRFSGTLPSIEAIDVYVTGLSLQIQPTGSLTCLMRSTATNPILIRILISVALRLMLEPVFEPGLEVPLTGSGGFCFFAGGATLMGEGTATVQGGTQRTEVILI